MQGVEYLGICSDLDGTLLMPDKSISPRTKICMTRFMEEGGQIVPTTGRAFHSIPKEVLDFPGIEYAIVSNGAAVYDVKKKEPIFQLTLQDDFAEKLIAFLREKGESVTYECFVKGQPYTSQAYFNNPADFGISRETELHYVQSTRIPVPDIEIFISEHRHELDALDVILIPENQERVSRMIAEHFEGIYITTSVSHLIEISHVDSGKHKAMRYLMEYLHIPMRQVIAFGDGNNDSEMLEAAGLGVAVANASDICKAAADVVIGESDQEAIALFLEELMERQIIETHK